MSDTFAEIVFHCLNRIAALFVLAITCPHDKHIIGLIVLPLTILALGCTALIAALSLVEA